MAGKHMQTHLTATVWPVVAGCHNARRDAPPHSACRRDNTSTPRDGRRRTANVHKPGPRHSFFGEMMPMTY
jgi:hypothetical protein